MPSSKTYRPIVIIALLLSAGALFVSLLSPALVYIANSSQVDALKSNRTHNRLFFCQQTEDVKKVVRVFHQKQIDKSEAYLKKNPNGVPGTNLDADLLRDGIAEEKAYVKALAPIDCLAIATSGDKIVEQKGL